MKFNSNLNYFQPGQHQSYGTLNLCRNNMCSDDEMLLLTRMKTQEVILGQERVSLEDLVAILLENVFDWPVFGISIF